MSQWEGDKEVGLSPGQTGGDVGGTYVERPTGSVTSTTYYTDESLKEQNIYQDPRTGAKITPDEAIRRGLEGGWQVGDKYYLTEQAAKNDIQKMQAIQQGNQFAQKNIQTWRPEWEKQYDPQFVKDLTKGTGDLMAGYKPYVTIEGTTVYTKPKDATYTIQRFGKMVPSDNGEPVLGFIQPDKFTKAIGDTINEQAKNFHYADLELASKLNLKEGVFSPALAAYRKANVAWAQTLPEEQRKRALDEGSQPLTQFIIGAGKGVAEQPLTAAGNAAAAIIVTYGTGGLVSRVPALAQGIGAGKIASQINAVNILGVSLAGMYGIDVAGRYAEAPNKAEFLGRLTSTELVPFAVGGYLGTKKLPIQYESVRSPSGEVLWKGISIRDNPLIGSSQQVRLILGNPKPEQIPRFKINEYMPVTKLETNIMARKSVMEAFGYSQKEIAKVDIGLKLMRETELQLSKFTESRLLRGTKSVSERGTDVFLKYVKEQKYVVDKIYGSFGARSQLKPEFRRLPGDIDIQLTTNEAGAVKFTKNLASRLRASGENVRVSKDNPTLIETYGKAGEHHAIDIHYKGEPTTDILTPGEEVSRYGLKLGQKSIKIEGYDIMPLSEQGIRKGSSVLTWRQKGKIAPAAHRLKDIPDFIATQITLIESKYGMVPNNHQKLINEWSKLFPEAKGIKGEVQLPLYQTVKGKQSPSISIGISVFPKIVTPSRSVSTSSGAKSYQSQYIASVSNSVEAISRSLSASVKGSAGSSSAKTSRPNPSYSGLQKIQSPNIRLASKILSPGSSKSTGSKTTPKSTRSKPVSKYSPYKSPSSTTSTPTPRKLPLLKLKDFTDEIESRSKRKTKGKYRWDIRNPVPTLESVLK